MATLEIVTNAVLDAQGLETVCKQGAIADSLSTAYSITAVTITGNKHQRGNALATSTIVKVYDSSTDTPATFDYLHFWADVDMYIQLITAGTEVRFKVLAKVPFIIPGYGSLIATAGTTAMAAEPVVAAIAKIYVANYSGGSGNYVLTIVD
jgi:hypothetical protein